MPSKHETGFKAVWNAIGPTGVGKLESEYRFAPPRRWKFDFALVDYRIAIELEGATFAGGRHTRGSGYAKDCEKYNRAAILGWIVLRYPGTDLTKRPVEMIEEIEAAITARNQKGGAD